MPVWVDFLFIAFLEDSLADYNKVVELDPKHLEANQAIRRLPPKVTRTNNCNYSNY